MNSRYSLTENDIVDGEVIGEDEITAKIPIEQFFQINNVQATFESPVTLTRIVLLVAKPDYMCYFGKRVYAIYLNSESDEEWVGKPIKNPDVGIMKWDKTKWIKIYGFTLSLTMQEEP